MRNNSFNTNIRSTPKFKPQMSKESLPSILDGSLTKKEEEINLL